MEQGDFGFGFILGALCLFFVALLVENYNFIESSRVIQCIELCKENENLAYIYKDGDCECLNGAFFDSDVMTKPTKAEKE